MIQRSISSIFFSQYIFISFSLLFLFFSAENVPAGGAAVKKQQVKPKGARIRSVQQRGVPAVDNTVRDVAPLDEVLQALKSSSHAWPLIIDMEAKQAVVDYFIKAYRKQGIVINKTTSHYVRVIDSMSARSPDMLVQPFEQVFKIVAILEYDFNNGQNRDGLALKILGTPEAVMQNKERLGIQ